MNRLIVPALAILAVGCNPEGEGDPSQNVEPADVNVTHQVCSSDGNEVLPREGIDQSFEFVLIDSIYAAPDSIDLDALPDADKATAAMATGLIGVIGLTDAFSLFTAIYDCTEEMRALNQCNWSIESTGPDDPDVSVSTAFDGSNYTTTVRSQIPGESEEVSVIIEGSFGDVGNGNFTLFGEDDDGNPTEATRIYSRDANGTERVVFDDDEGSGWTIQENADCDGSINYSSLTDDGLSTITLEVDWTRSGDSFSGLLEYADPDSFTGTYSLNF